MKTRIYMIAQNRNDELIFCVKFLGSRPGIPWRDNEVLSHIGSILVSYHNKGDYRDFKNHGIIRKPTV